MVTNFLKFYRIKLALQIDIAMEEQLLPKCLLM